MVAPAHEQETAKIKTYLPFTMLTRKIESLKWSWLAVALTSILFVCAKLFYELSRFGNGIEFTTGKDEEITFLNSLYFSVVTMSSLGYGDMRPLGWGRLVASFEVIAGLVIIAIIVSKLASDRTSTYVRLLYTSDSERRLKEQCADINERVAALQVAQKDRNHEKKKSEIKSIGLIVVNLKMYYQYQARIGALNEGWARKNSLKIAHAIVAATSAICSVGKESLITESERVQINRTLKHIQNAVEAITDSQNSSDFIVAKEQIARIIVKHNRYQDAGKRREIRSIATPYLIEEIRKILPPQPWQKDLHKIIAEQLRISKKLARKTLLTMEAEEESSADSVALLRTKYQQLRASKAARRLTRKFDTTI